MDRHPHYAGSLSFYFLADNTRRQLSQPMAERTFLPGRPNFRRCSRMVSHPPMAAELPAGRCISNLELGDCCDVAANGHLFSAVYDFGGLRLPAPRRLQSGPLLSKSRSLRKTVPYNLHSPYNFVGLKGVKNEGKLKKFRMYSYFFYILKSQYQPRTSRWPI